MNNRTIGMLGGISWVSTVDYYRYLNDGVNQRLGGINYARCIIHSVSFGDVITMGERNDMEGLYAMVSKACINLERSGAEALLLCANTMHRLADRLQAELNIPIIHVAEVTAEAIAKQELKTVSLLGTRFTMELDFFKEKLTKRGITTIIPDEADRLFIHENIFNELGKGIFTAETKRRYQDIIGEQVRRGAQGVILGCTEIPMLLKPGDLPVPSFDTTQLHASAAVEFALG